MSILTEERKVTLIETLFERPETEIDLKDYQTYFETVDTEIHYLNDSRDFRELLFRLQADQLVSVALVAVPRLRRNPSAEQGTILDSLRSGDIPGIQRHGLPREKTILEHILDGIVRIWLMVDPSPTEELHNTGWRGRRKLCDFVHGVFYPGQEAPKFPSAEATTARDHELMAEMASETTQVQSCLTHPLTVSNLKKLTNITTYWITHLEKHLEFDSDYSNLSVFTQNRWLLDAREIVQRWRSDHTPDPNIHPHNQPKM
ncbi:hypothetical protein FOPG_17084 [Fusarium oxysporum f. sp. conglutinans race 2 54008]|nr:hypothetical protein FOPG_17084 [Fusarium oxysporum f. sp. conglutinans race 2 54008]KAG7000293.1 hypothetical protein FocnCong_v013111 [Fusarium oxysporum f. sp. conglutinans]